MSLTQIENLMLPRQVADRTRAHLFHMGQQGSEGMALWVGAQNGETFRVQDVWIPRQKGVRSDHGLAVVVDGDELHAISERLYATGQRLVAQIHSHPTRAYHSAMDDRYAIATKLGSFSLVVPDFAKDPFTIARCAVYRLAKRPWWRFAGPIGWEAVVPADARRIIQVV